MLNFAREVFVSLCPTDGPRPKIDDFEQLKSLSFRQGGEDDLKRLSGDEHSPAYVEECRQRLADQMWLIGEQDSNIVTYTWLHQKDTATYRFLENCTVTLSDDCGYGYDAWTPPTMRGMGLRRLAFAEELYWLQQKGCLYEASFFVKHQLEGATRSLAKVGIEVIPVWRMKIRRDKSFEIECLNNKLKDIVRPHI